MHASASRREYDKRLHRVLAYIDQHLEQTLDLHVLAEVACFSAFHFHRLFTALIGETPGDYLHRRRLELAAMRLAAQPRLPVLQAALSVGFGSGEAFARAFKSRFGMSPSQWRKRQGRDSKIGQVDGKANQARMPPDGDHDTSFIQAEEILMTVTVIDRKPVTIAYLRHLGPYGAAVSRFWQQEVHPWLAGNGLMGRPLYGISHDDPAITAPEKCRYDAGVEADADYVAPAGVHKTLIPGGRYAVLQFRGTVGEIGEAWTQILRQWLPSSGYQLDSRPCFEHYPGDPCIDPKTGAFSCEICVPVVPL